jgi:hypothetical protein
MISTSNQFIKPLKMRYCDALKFSVILFSDSVLREPLQQPIQINECDDVHDYVEITNLKSKYQKIIIAVVSGQL